MIKNILKQTFLWFILVGTISWATAIISGNSLPTFIAEEHIQIGSYTNTLYRLDVYNYLKQIETATFNIPIEQMIGNFPALPQLSNLTDVGKIFVNIFIWYVNVLMYFFNIIIVMPVKLTIIQPLVYVATIVGIDLNSNGFLTVLYYLYTHMVFTPITYI